MDFFVNSTVLEDADEYQLGDWGIWRLKTLEQITYFAISFGGLVGNPIVYFHTFQTQFSWSSMYC